MKSMEGCGENLRALHKLPSVNLNDWKQRCKDIRSKLVHSDVREGQSQRTFVLQAPECCGVRSFQRTANASRADSVRLVILIYFNLCFVFIFCFIVVSF